MRKAKEAGVTRQKGFPVLPALSFSFHRRIETIQRGAAKQVEKDSIQFFRLSVQFQTPHFKVSEKIESRQAVVVSQFSKKC